MNYFTFRCLILCIIYMITFFSIIKTKLYSKILLKIGNSTLSKLILLFMFVIIYKIIWTIPYEGTIIKFKDLDDVITYFTIDEKLIKKYEYNDYAYVLHKNETNFPELRYFVRNKSNSWKLGNLLYNGKGKIIEYNDCFISIVKIPSKNSVGIVIYNPTVNKYENYEVYDSLDSEFDTFKYDIYNNYDIDYNEVIKVTIINEKVNSDYTIYFNGKEYKPFKK